MIESSMYYGHSMGGFVGLRLLNQPDLSIGGQPFSGLILESPMTMYSPILEEISTALRIPSPIKGTYRRRLIQRFNASITPRTKFHSMEEFDLPLWGGPSIPVLCIQADPDQRLGMEHYDRLLSTYKQRGQSELLTAHRVKGLTHTGAKIHPARNQLIAEWLSKRE
jgi:pimeloyl-ACP methyl ester carboxylesterase